MNERYDVPELSRLRWRFGGPRDFWIIHRKAVGQFVAKHDLKPIEAEHLQFNRPFLTVQPEEVPLDWPRPFPGGLRCAHLHFRGDLFEVEPEQWQQFSAEVVRDFHVKLDAAGTIPVDRLIELSDAFQGL